LPGCGRRRPQRVTSAGIGRLRQQTRHATAATDSTTARRCRLLLLPPPPPLLLRLLLMLLYSQFGD